MNKGNVVTMEQKAAPSTRRVGWAGGLDKDELSRPGARLMAMLLQAANDHGWQLQDLAAELGVSYGYIAQLRSGVRAIPNVSDDFLAAAASVLGISRMAAMAAAGKVTMADFYPPELASYLPAAVKAIEVDPQWAGLVPGEFSATSPEMQLFVVRLFERATGRNLLPQPISNQDIESYL